MNKNFNAHTDANCGDLDGKRPTLRSYLKVS